MNVLDDVHNFFVVNIIEVEVAAGRDNNSDSIFDVVIVFWNWFGARFGARFGIAALPIGLAIVDPFVVGYVRVEGVKIHPVVVIVSVI